MARATGQRQSKSPVATKLRPMATRSQRGEPVADRHSIEVTERNYNAGPGATTMVGPYESSVKNPSLFVLMMLLISGVMHAGWNAMAKGLSDTRTNFALLNLGVFVFAISVIPFVGFTPGRVLWYEVASIGIHQIYQLILMVSYTKGEFSTAYPVARGIAPLLVSFAGVVLANEHLTFWSYVGVVVVALGISSLSWSSRSRVTSPSAIWWALATGVAIAGYTVIDGYGVRANGDALQYGATLFFCQSLMWLVAISLRRGRAWIPQPKMVALGALGGILSMVAYTIVLWGQTRTTLGVVSAIRETGVLWAAMLGVFVFKEGRATTVIVPAAFVAIGILLLALG